MEDYKNKVLSLKSRVADYLEENTAVAFSGGVDSSLLLKLACEAGEQTGKDVYGILLHTMLHPSGDVMGAERIAKEIGAYFLVLELDELEEAGIEENPYDRCYLCKRYLFQALGKKAEEIGVSNILEGTNADDLKVYRPGIRVVRELGIHSPLAEAGFTKKEVRKLAKEYGISVSGKPSTPCLATRFPYGSRLTYDEIHKAEKGEAYLRGLGFYNVRLRVHKDIARIEVDSDDIARVIYQKEKIIPYLHGLGYTYITVDMEGFRSGSMDTVFIRPQPEA